MKLRSTSAFTERSTLSLATFSTKSELCPPRSVGAETVRSW